jgi:DNA-binding IscR family transcriptional regulator
VIGRTGVQALKALLELAQEPSRWRSVSDLAAAQTLPAPHLEQLLLKLRRAGVLEARRGRRGGYRLVGVPAEVSLGRVLAAVGAMPGGSERILGAALGGVGAEGSGAGGDPATERVAALLRQRLARAVERELERLTLAELLFDLRSAQASLSEEGGLMVG